MKKTHQIWAVVRTGLDSSATQPCAAYDSLSACIEVVKAHKELMAERGSEIPAAEKHLIPDLALSQEEYAKVGADWKFDTKRYVLLHVTHIQEAWA